MAVTNYFTIEGEMVGEFRGNTAETVETQVYLRDYLGSTVETRNADPSTDSRYQYLPYGGSLFSSGSGSTPRYLWDGTWGYRTTGLGNASHYVRARHYEGAVATWTSLNPAWPSENAYGYVDGMPLSSVAPEGLRQQPPQAPPATKPPAAPPKLDTKPKSFPQTIPGNGRPSRMRGGGKLAGHAGGHIIIELGIEAAVDLAEYIASGGTKRGPFTSKGECIADDIFGGEIYHEAQIGNFPYLKHGAKPKFPGDCTDAQFVYLYNSVVRDCKQYAGRSCGTYDLRTHTIQCSSTDCKFLRTGRRRFDNCLKSRQKLEDKCFPRKKYSYKDRKGHLDQIRDVTFNRLVCEYCYLLHCP